MQAASRNHAKSPDEYVSNDGREETRLGFVAAKSQIRYCSSRITQQVETGYAVKVLHRRRTCALLIVLKCFCTP